MSTTGLSPLSHQDVLESTARLIDKQLKNHKNKSKISYLGTGISIKRKTESESTESIYLDNPNVGQTKLKS
jgi:hypothetical protein